MSSKSPSKVPDVQRLKAAQESLYSGPRCGYCGAKSRAAFHMPSGTGKKNSRKQHARFFKCQRGHKLYVKRGDI